jgi:hypothetical protein
VKRVKTGLQKQLWQSEEETFFEIFLLCLAEGSNKNILY